MSTIAVYFILHGGPESPDGKRAVLRADIMCCLVVTYLSYLSSGWLQIIGLHGARGERLHLVSEGDKA